MAASNPCPRCGRPWPEPRTAPVCDVCWDGLPSRLRRAVSRLPARAKAQWAAGTREVQPAARKKRTPHGRRPPPAPAPAPVASRAPSAPQRLSFLPSGPAVAEPEPEVAPEPATAVPPRPSSAALRREQARIRRAALIADQLGDADLPFYFVDFMSVEDLAPTLGFEAAVATVAQRDGRTAAEVEGAWHDAVGRLVEDERCRYVDALRPYLDRIDAELE